jgi:hypothetical protein
MKIFPLVCVFAASVLASDPVSYKVHGQSWAQMGRLVHSSDSILADDKPYDVSGNSMQSLGGQLTIDAELGEHWKGSFGMGVFQISQSLGSVGGSINYPLWFNVSMWRAYIAQANLTYCVGSKENPWLSFTAGNFSENYNPDVKNLGLYLLRGPVYPGVLMSGFQEFDTDSTKATQTGFKIHNALGNFTQDLLFLNERNLPPTFDWSLAYVAKYRAFGALDIGGGVNFYRLIPYNSELETPGHLGGLAPQNSFQEIAPGDTVFYTHQGIKLMGMFSLDPKRWLPFGNMGAEDFKLYGEVAVIGVKNQGNYYKKIEERIPVMGGFNIPTFGILDMLSFELEWYGSPYRNDLALIGYPASIVAPWQDPKFPIPSPGPVKPGTYADSTADNVKWSLFFQKTVSKHVRFTGQIANDHYRPGPLPEAFINSVGGTQAVLTRPSDWYYMARLGFFF